MAVVWDRGVIHEFCVNVASGTMDATTTFDVVVNSTTTYEEVFSLPATGANTAVVLEALVEVPVEIGDIVDVKSGGETGNSVVLDGTLVLRR